jgi:hypothetical protein
MKQRRRRFSLSAGARALGAVREIHTVRARWWCQEETVLDKCSALLSARSGGSGRCARSKLGSMLLFARDVFGSAAASADAGVVWT